MTEFACAILEGDSEKYSFASKRQKAKPDLFSRLGVRCLDLSVLGILLLHKEEST